MSTRDAEDGPAGEKPRREPAERLLRLVVGVLAAVALTLAAVLALLLKPSPKPPGHAAPEAGCPIKPVRSIYGFGSAKGQSLSQPQAVTFDRAGNLWVADTGNSRVLVFTPEGRLVREIGPRNGPGRLWAPFGITADPAADRMYVADYRGRAVLIYSSGGQYLDRLPAADQDPAIFGSEGFSPYEARPHKGKVVVASGNGLYFFDRHGRVVAHWGAEWRGRGLKEFNFPNSFVVDPKTDRFYVTDTGNRRVMALDSAGRVLWISGLPDVEGKIVGFWQLPRAIALGSDGRLYVVDIFRYQEKCAGVGHIVVLSSDGRLLSEFGRAGPQEDAFNFPERIALGPDGLVAVADRENNRVLLFRLGPLPPPTSEEAASYRGSLWRAEGEGKSAAKPSR
ncbi:MAG: hypothetical protein HY775_05070 [Acidobacteria bacterium]|nr:hypothetical protein [Acidobacteriota bacterium]